MRRGPARQARRRQHPLLSRVVVRAGPRRLPPARSLAAARRRLSVHPRSRDLRRLAAGGGRRGERRARKSRRDGGLATAAISSSTPMPSSPARRSAVMLVQADDLARETEPRQRPRHRHRAPELAPPPAAHRRSPGRDETALRRDRRRPPPTQLILAARMRCPMPMPSSATHRRHAGESRHPACSGSAAEMFGMTRRMVRRAFTLRHARAQTRASSRARAHAICAGSLAACIRSP